MNRKIGSVRTASRLTTFLYLLARDQLTWGEMEELMEQVEGDGTIKDFELTDRRLAEYATELAERLR